MPDGQAALDARRTAALAAAAVAVFALHAVHYRGPATGYWDTYIAVPAALLTGDAVRLTELDGTPRIDARAPERLPHDLVQPDTFGIATHDQGLGAGIHHALGFLGLGRAGLRLTYALDLALLSALVALAATRLPGVPFPVALGAGLLAAVNPMTLAIGTLNAGLPSTTAIALVFWLFLRPRPPWLLAGAVLGVLGGIRDMSVFFVPAIVLWIVTAERPLRALVLFGAGALATIAPILVWKAYAYGSPLADPTQYAGHRGFRPTFTHHFFGQPFEFNGLLNVPFHDRWVRTPHFPFPTYVGLPLSIARCFGSLGVAAALVGMVRLVRLDRRFAAFTWLWFWLFYAFLSPQENWEELKGTTIVLLFVPWCLWIAVGVAGLAADAARRRRTALALAAVAVAVTVVGRLAARVDAPADPRWYERFPLAAANETGLAELPDEERLTWRFFHTRETAAEIERRRAITTAIWPWPMPYVAPPPGPRGTRAQLAREWGDRHLAIFDVWDRIYGPPAR